MNFLHVRAVLIVTGTLTVSAGLSQAEPRTLLEGKRPNDVRLKRLKHLNDYFPFHVPETLEAWKQRRTDLKNRILVAAGIWPMPSRTPLNPVIYGKTERDDFTVEKVYFESYPAHFVTGLLFRPKESNGPAPAVLCPHGHGGRLQDHGPTKIRQLIVEGRERFEGSGRFPKLARCAQLARMGCVTFIFDMIGYADSRQIPRAVAHGLQAARPHLENSERWGLFTTQAELRLQNSFGIQTWNSIRALDFLCSLPGVDTKRIGVTGGSGGGTQTLILCAIDDRPIANFPQGMVSTAMQGGCLCENASLLRIGTGNVELAAIFAPRPMAMTAAKDWTVDMMTKGYPQLQKLYDMYGASKNVACTSLVHFPHNYNYVTRALMYDWFNKHLKIGLPAPIVEEDFAPLTPEEYTVWDEQHPAPKSGEEYEVALTRWLAEDNSRQLEKISPAKAGNMTAYRKVLGTALKTIIGRDMPSPDAISVRKVRKTTRDGYLEMGDILRLDSEGEEVPVIWLHPTENWNKQVIVWTSGTGKQDLFSADGTPRKTLQNLLSKGYTIVGADLFQQGEFREDGAAIKTTRTVDGDRGTAVYAFGYNHTLCAHRVHDIMTLVAMISGDSRAESIHLVGLGEAGPVAVVASAVLRDQLAKRVIAIDGFRFKNVRSYRHVNFFPGAVKYGDISGFLALSAPHPLYVSGEALLKYPLVRDAYLASNAERDAVSIAGDIEQLIEQAF